MANKVQADISIILANESQQYYLFTNSFEEDCR